MPFDPKLKQRKKKNRHESSKKRHDSSSESDSSVDEHGNIRGLIDYDYDSDEFLDAVTSESGASSNVTPIAARTRSSKRRTRYGSDTESTSSDEPPRKRSHVRLIEKLRKEKRRLKRKAAEREREREREQLRRKEHEKAKKRSLAKALLKKKKQKDKHSSSSNKIHHRLKRLSVDDEETAEDDTDYEDEEETYVTEDETDAEDEDNFDDETEEEDDEEEEEDEDLEEEGDDGSEEESDEDSPPRAAHRAPGIAISFGIDDEMDRMVPKRYNLKKEGKDVQKFVKLITEKSDEDTIDGQIDQFKALDEEQRNKLLEALESRNKKTADPGDSPKGLMFKILTMELPKDTKGMVLSKYNSLQTIDPGSAEYFKLRNWLEKLTSLPFGMYKEIPVKIADGSETCGAFMEKARKCLDEAIYGQDEAKLQVLQFIGTKIANPDGRGLSILLAGPPGIGKTSLIKNGIAKALGWPFQFISLGGDSDATTYTGHQLVYEGSHCGKIVNSLINAKSMSMVLLFDELDKISTTNKGEEVANMLVHLTDPVQNADFEDKYLSGIPIDLSKVMFTFSANYLERIDKVLLDRMTVVNLEGYSKKEKIAIAENYLLPAALKEVGLTEKISFSTDVIPHILENYANEEKGVRELKRCMEQIAQKMNMLRIFNSKSLPFHIKDFSLPFNIKKDHIDILLKKKESKEDISHLRMYT